jgi:hypothetical protein
MPKQMPVRTNRVRSRHGRGRSSAPDGGGPPAQLSRDGEWYWDGSSWSPAADHPDALKAAQAEAETEAVPTRTTKADGNVEHLPPLTGEGLPIWPPAADKGSGWDGRRLIIRQGRSAMLPFVVPLVPVVLLMIVLAAFNRQYIIYGAVMLVVLVALNLFMSGWWKALGRPVAVLGLDPEGIRATDGGSYDIGIPWGAVKGFRLTRYFGLSTKMEFDVDLQRWRPSVTSSRALMVLQRDLGNKLRTGRISFFPDGTDAAELSERIEQAVPASIRSAG